MIANLQGWYEDTYHGEMSEWLKGIKRPGDLLALYEYKHRNHKRRFNLWTDPIVIRGRLLEIGFNNGKSLLWFAERFSAEGLRVVGLDFSRALMPVAQLLPDLHPNIDGGIIADCQHIPFRGGSMDHVACLDFIEHIPEDEYQAMLDEIARVMKPRGLVFVHVGRAKQKEHIHIISHAKLVGDMVQRGYTLLYRIAGAEIFSREGKPGSEELE